MQHPDRSGWGDTLAAHLRDSWTFYAFQWTPPHLTRERHEQLLRNLEIDPAAFARLIETYEIPGVA
jgi:hypothetical protein